MKINRKNRENAARILLVLLASVAQAQMKGLEISAFRVPEYDAQGVMTSQLFGERAEGAEGDEVKITGLRVEFYKDGKTAMEVTSPYCFYDQKTRVTHSDAPMTADMDRVHVRGQGFLLKPGESNVRILNNSHVTLENIIQQAKSDAPLKDGRETNNLPKVKSGGLLKGDLLPKGDRGTNAVTVITSKELFFQYKAKTVRFEQNVHVQDPKMVLDSGSLEVRFGENNEINWIEALTNVKILSEGREANAGKAVYDVTTDEFVLEDNPSFKDGKNTLFGDKVRYWRSSGRMVCEPRARLVIYAGKDMKTDLFGK